MANKKGRGLLMVYCDVPPDVEEEFNEWYNQEHIPERLSIPGVLNAARYEALQGGPKYLACYELDTHQAWHSPEWQHWLNNPTEWSNRMSPSAVATTYIRNLYRLIYPDNVDQQTSQADMAPVMLVGRMSVPAELDSLFNQSYNQERLPECYSTPGYVRGRRFEADMGEPKYLTIHEMESESVPKSPEWSDWTTRETPVWSRQVRPHMVHAEGSPGVYRRIFPSR